MGWPITDFEGVKFNEGGGYAEVVAIHQAIRQRMEGVGMDLSDGIPGSSTIPLTYFEDPWTATVWLADTTGGSTGTRQYLKNFFRYCYRMLNYMVDGSTDISGQFEFTDEIDGTAWTMETLTADIGMGEFFPLLTKPTNPAPFIWLHEALDRLVYVRQVRGKSYVDNSTSWYTSSGGSGGSGSDYLSYPWTTESIAWGHRTDVVIGTVPNVGGAGGIGTLDYWQMKGYLAPLSQPLPTRDRYFVTMRRSGTVGFDFSAIKGPIVGGKYGISVVNNCDVDIDFQVAGIASSVPALSPPASSGAIASLQYVNWDTGVSLPEEAITEILLRVTVPASVPFSGVQSSGTVRQTTASLIIYVVNATFYQDLTTILDDQAP